LSFAKPGLVSIHFSEYPSQPLTIQAALNLEGSMQANRNDEDAPEKHYEISGAEQFQLSLVRQES